MSAEDEIRKKNRSDVMDGTKAERRVGRCVITCMNSEIKDQR